MSWQEQQRKEGEELANRLLDENKNKQVKQQKTSFVEHKCSTCKSIIPSGQPLIRETEKIYVPSSDTPFFKSKYFCNQECYEQKGNPLEIKKKEDKVIIPQGFEII